MGDGGGGGWGMGGGWMGDGGGGEGGWMGGRRGGWGKRWMKVTGWVERDDRGVLNKVIVMLPFFL